jgi:5'-3' exonuclease
MILLVDGPNLLHRTHWVAQKSNLVNEKGDDVGCEFKFLRSLFSLANRFRPSEFYVAWDRGSADPNYRKTLTEGTYKAGRDKSSQDSVNASEAKVIPVISNLGIKNMVSNILEADDLIAWLSKKLEEQIVTIVSCDKDFLQLVERRVQVFSPAKQQLYTIDNFKDLIGVEPKRYLRYKAMIGDPADNLRRPELKGLGPKTALRVMSGECVLTSGQEKAVHDLVRLMSFASGLMAHPQEEEFYEQQFQLVKDHKSDFEAFKEYCHANNFKSILDAFDKWKLAFGKNRLVELINSLAV